MNYKTQIDPLGVVAIRKDQHEVNAPNHDTWGEVVCGSCNAVFFIGPNRIYGFRGQQADFIKKLEDILNEDHQLGHAHQNAYELGG